MSDREVESLRRHVQLLETRISELEVRDERWVCTDKPELMVPGIALRCDCKTENIYCAACYGIRRVA